jgi:hypothetical protein
VLYFISSISQNLTHDFNNMKIQTHSVIQISLGRMLRRSKIPKPPMYRKRQDVGADGSGVKHPLDSNTEYYTVTDVHAGTCGATY